MDIDTDFATSIRDKVVDYVSKRYAYKKDYWVKDISTTVCNIVTQGTLAAKKSIRQVGKVTGKPYVLCDRVAKLIPGTPGISIKKALDEVDALRNMYNADDEVRQLIDDAMLVEGIPDQTGVHAAGVIIADKPVVEYAPMFWNVEKNCWVIQFDMVSCESDVGCLKMDFLGLRNLDIIMRAKRFIRAREKYNNLQPVSFRTVNDCTDLRVIKNIYATGDTNGVFQFESGGMKKTLKSFIPKTIDDVILLNAAYRPGPLQYIPEVTDVKFGRKDSHYIVPEMESILGATYGSPIYQEQIQQIFHEIAGFSLGQADIIRRAMSKKHLDELEAAKDKFVEGFKRKGAKDTDIETFWGQLLAFASYAFNKSHAAAYSVLSYRTAWLKYYYPVEYMASLMSYSGKEDIAMYVADCKRYGIEVSPPDVNKSIVYTAATRSKREIRFGLEGIKDVSAAAEKVVTERNARGEFSSYEDFVIRCSLMGINKSAITALTVVGALDDLFEKSLSVHNRREGVENAETYLEQCRTRIKSLCKKDEEILTLIDSGLDKEDEKVKELLYLKLKNNTQLFSDTVKCKDFNFNDKLQQEKEFAGYYISGSPLDNHIDLINRHASVKISDVSISDEVTLVGLIDEFKELKRKSDGAAMCKFKLEDDTGVINVICFTRVYPRIKSQVNDGAVVSVKGKITSETTDTGETLYQLVLTTCKRLA